MMIKKICTIDRIKKELDIDFDNLELVGSYKTARNNKINAIYKDHNNFFIFKIKNSSEIYSIAKVKNVSLTDEGSDKVIIFDGAFIYYDEEKILFIDKFKDKYEYNIYEWKTYNRINFLCNERLKLTDEEAVILNLMDDFFNEEILNKN